MRAVLSRASAAIDRGAVRLMEARLAPRRRRSELSADDARARLIALAAAYRDGTLGAPSPFFPAPERPAVRLTPVGEGPLGTQVVDLAYPSEYVPYLAAARDPHQRATDNLTARARWWTQGRNRPTLVMIHGWGGGHPWLSERAFGVPYWLRHGYDVAAFVMPHHGARAPGSRVLRSGTHFPSLNPLRTNEAFGQAIHDLRALARFLRERGATAIGAIGMSLGGYTTGLWASVAGPADVGGLDLAVAIIPAVSLAKLMWDHGADHPERARAVRGGIDVDLLADAFAVHAPTTRPARVPRERRFVIAGERDQITPPEQAEALAAHWGVPVRWFAGGHLAQLGRADAIRALRRALGALDLPGRVFRGEGGR